jgi:hypothetical protein
VERGSNKQQATSNTKSNKANKQKKLVGDETKQKLNMSTTKIKWITGQRASLTAQYDGRKGAIPRNDACCFHSTQLF